jgi:hypothetical protein
MTVDMKDKSESLAEQMNGLTKKLDLADELELSGDDIIEYVEEKTDDVKLYTDETAPAEIINLENLVQDFKFVRETLKENTTNGRRVLNAVTLDLLDSDNEKRASLIVSFAELNRAVADNMKLYINSYKEISNILLNLNKIKQSEIGGPKNPNQVLIVGTEAVSTVDLIRKLSTQNEQN